MQDRKMKWPLIADRSRQQKARQNEKSTSGMDRIVKELNYPRDNTSAATIPQPSQPLPARPHSATFISAIGFIIAMMFGCLFGLMSRELGDFNYGFNVLNCDFELEKSGHGLSNEYDLDCDARTSPTIDALFNFGVRGVGLAECNNLGCSSSAVLMAFTIATIITNENENEMIFASGQLCDTQTQTSDQLNSNDKIGPAGVGLGEFDNVPCIFGGCLCQHNIFDHFYDSGM